MMNPFGKPYRPDLSIKDSIARRLRRTSNEETVRWMDNAHTGMGKNLSEMRKSLTRGDVDQTLVYMADARLGAVTILSALEIMEERLTSVPLSRSTESRTHRTPMQAPEHISLLRMLG